MIGRAGALGAAILIAASGCADEAPAGSVPPAVVPGALAQDGIKGDPVHGEQVYHSLEHDRTGPRHCGLIGRRAGSVPGFEYSPAMIASGIVWDEASLDRFLADPPGVVPGTKMTFVGVADPVERRDLVAWLSAAGADPSRCPTE